MVYYICVGVFCRKLFSTTSHADGQTVTLQRNLLRFASAFTKRNVERNVRNITRDHMSAFSGRIADEVKGKACLKISGLMTEV